MAKKTLSMDQLNELIECFESVKEPRVANRCKHRLIDVIAIAVIGTLCGAEGIRSIYEFALMKEQWLRKYLELPEGIPSEDTVARILSIIDSSELEKAFQNWVKIIADEKTKSISLDGKYTKGTDRTFNRGNKPLLIISAYSHELGLSLVEKEGPGGSEIEGTLACLEALDLKGVMVKVDAGIGCSRVIEKVREKKGDYLIPLKANQWFARNEVADFIEKNKNSCDFFEAEEKGRGREERRACHLLSAKKMSQKFKDQWSGVKSVFILTRERIEDDKSYVIQETGKDGKQSYRLNDNDLKYSELIVAYISSRELSAEKALLEAREHWSIENKVHWVLDVAFREDNCGVRAKALARTLSLLRKAALNIVRRSKTKGSVRGRMQKAGWSNDFLDQLLFKEAF